MSLTRFLLTFLCIGYCLVGFCQPYSTIDLYKQKPKPYEDRLLASEKSDESKLNKVKKFFNNGFTHYNYVFNAENKLKEAIAKAKLLFKDDFNHLIPFYNYSYEDTKKNKADFDTLIYKSNAGILLHDLGSAWVDNMYMIMGKAYMLQKNFDSAAYVFQYINYAWAPNDDGYILPIGSNRSNTDSFYSISTKEKTSFVKKIFTTRPSRNEAFLWMAKSFIEQGKVAKARGVLTILRGDKNFPPRLQLQLDEMLAYSCYKLHIYDSAAYFLEKALPIADGSYEKARWEFLCGQMYQLTQNGSAAKRMFEKSIATTPEPMLEIYARLELVKLASAGKSNALDKNLRDIYRLARKDRYSTYRDIFYYAAAQLEIQRKNIPAATIALQKSLLYNIENPDQRNRSFLLLADMSYDNNRFPTSSSNYDSIAVKLPNEEDQARITFRRPPLHNIALNMAAIHYEDSVQAVALMPEPGRSLYVRKLLKRLLKEKGLKESDAADRAYYSAQQDNNGNNTTGFFNYKNEPLKKKAMAEFKALWGDRPNVDNWRRIEAIGQQQNRGIAGLPTVDDVMPSPKERNKETPFEKEKQPEDLSFEGLMSKLPLTSDSKKISDSTIAKSLFENAITFQNDLENPEQALRCYDTLLQRFGGCSYTEQALFNMVYCYHNLGEIKKADSCATLLKNAFGKGKYAERLKEGGKVVVVSNDTAIAYQNVMKMIEDNDIEGAKKAKEAADNLYGNGQSGPISMLLEAITKSNGYQDGDAMHILNEIVTKYPTSPTADEAKRLMSKIKNRINLENQLANYDDDLDLDPVQRHVDLNPTSVITDSAITGFSFDSLAKPPLAYRNIVEEYDSLQKIREGSYLFDASDMHYVVLVLQKQEEAMDEIINAFEKYNKEKYYNSKIETRQSPLNSSYKLLLFGPFDNASSGFDYLEDVGKQAPVIILQWLPKSKYRFDIISKRNFAILQGTQDLDSYDNFIKQIFPNKF